MIYVIFLIKKRLSNCFLRFDFEMLLSWI